MLAHDSRRRRARVIRRSLAAVNRSPALTITPRDLPGGVNARHSQK
jgi:hypothetical protein